MGEFQRAFSTSVEAAVDGDFSRRIERQFGDVDLDQIAANFNAVLGNVDAGLEEAGKVLSAIAHTDLTLRVEGEYHGAFANLRNDINAMADRLSAIIAQLRTTSTSLKIGDGRDHVGGHTICRAHHAAGSNHRRNLVSDGAARNHRREQAGKAEGARRKAAQVSQSAQQSGQVMQQANTQWTASPSPRPRSPTSSA